MIVAQRVFGLPLQSLFHLLCAFRFEFGDRQGTVGKRLTSSFPWSLRRQAGELSEPSTIDTNHPRPNLGGPKEIFRLHTVQIGIIQVKVDGLERSSQHRNMHRLSTCDRDRRVTDTARRHDDQIPKV